MEVLKKNDQGVYNALVKAGVNVSVVTKTIKVRKKGKIVEQEVTDYSKTLSKFFNENCNKVSEESDENGENGEN